LVHGVPADELLRAAAGAQLVVVGTHGHGAPARVLLGSTSRTVVRYSPCPVMVVRWDAVVDDPTVDPASVRSAGAGSAFR
jgi:nucleotide-binding universal stress UspA family protein